MIHANGTLVSPSAPAETGEVVSVFLTGLGQVNGEITAGQPSPPLTARVPVVAQLGAASVNPSYAGLAPGFAGLYQVNLTVPAELPTGTHKLRISAKENLSNTVDLSVRSTLR